MKRVRVRVPASSANLGPGFDCLGLALSLYHSMTVIERDGEGVEIFVAGEGADHLPRNEENVVYRAMDSFFQDSGYRPGRLTIAEVWAAAPPPCCRVWPRRLCCLAVRSMLEA